MQGLETVSETLQESSVTGGKGGDGYGRKWMKFKGKQGVRPCRVWLSALSELQSLFP